MRGKKGRKVGKKEDGFGPPVFLMLLTLFLLVLQPHPKHLFAASLQVSPHGGRPGLYLALAY